MDGDVKTWNYCHISEKYRYSVHRDSYIKDKLNHKIPIVFNKLKKWDWHLIMQELDKFDFKINVIPNGLEKYISFNINNRIIFTDSFQFVSSSLDILIRNLGKDDFEYSSQQFFTEVLDLVKQIGFYLYEYLSSFENFEKELSKRERFYS